MKIALFSTDFNFEPIVDQELSAMLKCQISKPGQQIVSYGGTYFYRMCMPYMEVAKNTGHEVIVTWMMDSKPDGTIVVIGPDGVAHEDCDVIVMQRWMHEEGVERIRRARAVGQVVINDVDDYFFGTVLPTTNIARKTTSAKNNALFNRDHYLKNIAASSAITCSTATIASGLSRQGPPVYICRNAIDLERWPQHDPGGAGCVGWVGGIPWRGNDLPLLRGIIGPYCEEQGAAFYHGGESPDPNYPKAWQQLGIDTNRVQYFARPLTHIAEYPALWDPLALAVIPLEDCTFNRAKSWLKGLEACACGIPFIASRLPEYELLGAGRLVKSKREWWEALEALADPETRRVEGARNRQRAEELNIAVQWRTWLRVLEDLVPSRALVPYKEPVAA